MSFLKNGFIGTLGFLGISDIIRYRMKDYDTTIAPPIDLVSIIMPSYNEDMTIQTAVESIRNQSIIKEYPEYFEFILVDSQSKDRTVEKAIPYVDRIINVPMGKLTARNIAIDESKGNIIISVDSDTMYPEHWLNTLLKPFNQDQSIIATVGSTFDYTIPNVPGEVYLVISTLFLHKILYPNIMTGRNSAFYKHYYYLSGGFNENINQFDIEQMVEEEERGFGRRLSKLGKVLFKVNASCYHLGGLKVACRNGLENKEICKRFGIGTDRF